MARRTVSRRTRLLLQRISAGLLVLVVVPILVTFGTMTEEAGSIVVGQPAPRTVVATRFVRQVDQEATARARQQAREAVSATLVSDLGAQRQMVDDVRELFNLIEDARREVPDVIQEAPSTDPESGEVTTPAAIATTRPPTDTEQIELLSGQTELLAPERLRDLVELSPADLRVVESEAVELAQDLAREQITAGNERDAVDDFLDRELALRDLPTDMAEDVIRPLFRSVVRPTVQVDTEATDRERDAQEARVEEVAQSFQADEPIIRVGQIVEPLQEAALRELQLLGLDNDGPIQTAVRVFAVLAIATLAILAFLWRMQPAVWASGRKILVLAALVTGHGLFVALATYLTNAATSSWWYVVPAGAIAMLAAILITPWVGLATVLTSTTLVLVTFPSEPGLAVFTAASVIVSVPFVMRLSSRAELRSAVLRGALLYPLLAAVTEAVFGTFEDVPTAMLAAAFNTVATILLVQGMLPFMEQLFRLPTITALLDLADRNHPLLRELEQKAMGSYNHSVAVASLVERACREIGADALLGSVAALYHDIGKVRRPHFFIENQRGIANPHDELEPQVSALIIQDHVKDGVAMAREYKLPPEVVACIGSHHGTMLVSFFYRQALEAATEGEEVDENVFRYDGAKPRSREAAVLLLADCCEATTRSMTMSSGTMDQDKIEAVVDRLLQERLDDAQFAESELTFADLYKVRDSIVDALVGIYHPRIAYPDAPKAKA